MLLTPLSHKWKFHFKTGIIIGKCVTVETIIGDYKKSNEINQNLFRTQVQKSLDLTVA